MHELTGVLEPALSAVGELLRAERTETALVVVGGATLNLLGLVDRTTQDVDVIALASAPIGVVPALLAPPDPLPDALQRAILRVARDFGLAPDWINTAIARQWSQGLPPWLPHDITWRRYAGLHVGLVVDGRWSRSSCSRRSTSRYEASTRRTCWR